MQGEAHRRGKAQSTHNDSGEESHNIMRGVGQFKDVRTKEYWCLKKG